MTPELMEQEIAAIPKFGTAPDLSNLKTYLDLLGHPEEHLRVIHVAGTNGKGSVCAFLESILRRAGYKTALFTSPHLVRLNERFRINFEPCSDEKLTAAWEQVKGLMEQEMMEQEMMQGQGHERRALTYFEVLFLMALLLFKEEDPDYCIMETGLGGRLDATVLTNPVLCVITSISLDHTDVLGDRIEDIAREKAGIIKPGVPVVAFDEENGAFPVFEKAARERHSHIYKLRSEEVTIFKKNENTIDFSLNNRYYKNSLFCVHSHALYQAYNGALALISAHILLPDLAERTLREGLSAMRWEGRMEEILPGVFADGAHNPGAVLRARQTVEEQGGDWCLLFAVCGDKDYDAMIRLLAAFPWVRITVTSISGIRRAAAREIASCFKKYTDGPLVVIEDAEAAMRCALREKKERERLLCLGSLYLVGEIKKRGTYILESEDL